MQPIISSLSLDRMRAAIDPCAGPGEDVADYWPRHAKALRAADWAVLAFSGLVAFLPSRWLRGRQA